MAIHKQENCLVSERFESLGDFIETITSRKGNGIDEASEKIGSTGDTWSGTATFKEAEKLALFGWKNGLKMASKMINELGEPDQVIEAQGNEVMPVGGVFIIPAVIANAPAYMLNPCAPMEQPIIRLVVSTGFLSGCKAEQKIAKGVAIMALVGRLERAGQSVEVVSWKGVEATSGSLWSEVSVVIKQPDQAMDLDVLAYVLAHPSFQRRHNFKWIETISPANKAKRSYGMGHGRTAELPDCEGSNVEEHAMYIKSTKSSDSTDPLDHYRDLKKQALDAGLVL
jgi:hypothetical protein